MSGFSLRGPLIAALPMFLHVPLCSPWRVFSLTPNVSLLAVLTLQYKFFWEGRHTNSVTFLCFLLIFCRRLNAKWIKGRVCFFMPFSHSLCFLPCLLPRIFRFSALMRSQQRKLFWSPRKTQSNVSLIWGFPFSRQIFFGGCNLQLSLCLTKVSLVEVWLIPSVNFTWYF